MESGEDRLFVRWCRHGDADALGELFDLVSPRLLKLAIHLVGEPVEAEDLVQATFLAAIEQRASIDSARPPMPWLSAVLAHKAGDAKRRAARVLDPRELVSRDEAEASRPLERRELSCEIANAIERLDEPYRQVLLLRLRHGMEPADIAHLLGTSPGTVRVQLHRGLEKLRQRLPATLVSSLFLGVATPRGLAAVKAVVAREATASLAVATATPVLGGILVSKRALLVAAVAVLLVGLVVWYERFARRSDTHEALGAPMLAQPPEPKRISLAPLAADPSDGTSATRRAVDEPRPEGLVVRGVVVDGETGLPVAGARVRLFARHSTRLSRLARDRPDRFQVLPDGKLMARGFADWPFIAPLSTLARFDRAETIVYDEPEVGEEPLAERSSAADGTFALPCDANGGILVCEHERYGRRVRAAHDPELAWDLALWPEREIAGRVIDVDGKPVEQPLRIVLLSTRPPVDSRTKSWEAIGSWTVDTTAGGRFALKVSAPEVRAQTATPGWQLTPQGVNPSNGQRWVFPTQFDVQASEQEILLVAARVPTFRFFDARTGAPVERVRLLGREQANQYVCWSGEFAAPGGLLSIPGDFMWLQSLAGDPLRFTAWSAGYRESSWNVSDMRSTGVVEVSMEPGQSAVLEGFVLRDGGPVGGAHVALLGRSPLQWSVEEDFLLDAVATASDGRFQLQAADGSYVVRVTLDDEPFVERVDIPEAPGMWEMRVVPGRDPYFEQVELPARGPLVIDLARTATIEVEVVDGHGRARESHTVALRGEDGRSLRMSTDAQGRTSFQYLPAGKFTVHVPHVSTRLSFSGGELVEVELSRGETRSVRIEVPASTGPRHARVVVSGVSSYSEWRARYDGGDWHAILQDGTVPLDLETAKIGLEIAAPDSRRWSVEIPKDAPDGTEIRLDAGVARYRGVLLDGNGEPIAGVRVFAEPQSCEGYEAAEASDITNEHGRFEIAGLAPCIYDLSFHSNPERSRWYDYDSAYQGTRFHPSAPASDDTWLEIRLAGASDTVRIRGVVRRESDSTAIAGAMLWFSCENESPFGAVQLGGNRSYVHTDAEGRFEIMLPRTKARTVRVYAGPGLLAALTRSFDDAGRGEEEIELEVP